MKQFYIEAFTRRWNDRTLGSYDDSAPTIWEFDRLEDAENMFDGYDPKENYLCEYGCSSCKSAMKRIEYRVELYETDGEDSELIYSKEYGWCEFTDDYPEQMF